MDFLLITDFHFFAKKKNRIFALFTVSWRFLCWWEECLVIYVYAVCSLAEKNLKRTFDFDFICLCERFSSRHFAKLWIFHRAQAQQCCRNAAKTHTSLFLNVIVFYIHIFYESILIKNMNASLFVMDFVKYLNCFCVKISTMEESIVLIFTSSSMPTLWSAWLSEGLSLVAEISLLGL